jgi:hypothetical protein
MCRLNERQPAIFDEWYVAAREFDLKLVSMMARAEQHSLSLQVNTCLAVLQDTLDDVLDLCRFVAAVTSCGRSPNGLFEKSCLRKPSVACAMIALHASRIGSVER